MHAVKHIAVQLYAVLVCDGRQVQHRIGGAGNGGMDEDGVFKCLFCHDISRADARARQRYRLFARAPRIVCQQRACGRNKRAARKRKPQGLGHHLHRARRAHKAACSAGRAGMGLIKPELLRGDLAALILGAVCTDLLQRQQIRPRIHHTAGTNMPGVFSRPEAIRFAGRPLSQLAMYTVASKGVAIPWISMASAMISLEASE